MNAGNRRLAMQDSRQMMKTLLATKTFCGRHEWNFRKAKADVEKGESRIAAEFISVCGDKEMAMAAIEMEKKHGTHAYGENKLGNAIIEVFMR